jgi:5-methylcytosine-specific restriction endonuclease McrA
LHVLERDSWQCKIDGPRCTGQQAGSLRTQRAHVDHVIPWQEGGAWLDPANLRAACEPCNTGRGAQRMHAMAKLNRQPATRPSRDW